MAAGADSSTVINRSLQETPTWALATVCFIFIFLGIVIEHLIHKAGHWLKKHKKVAVYEATEKLKSVLMQLGFMSLILTVTARSISKICIPNKVADSMLPCRSQTSSSTRTSKALEHLLISFSTDQRTMLSKSDLKDLINNVSHHERSLAASTSKSLDHCGSKGMTSLMSQEGINQLNIFIFVLAAMQVVYSMVTMGLGRAKMKRWKSWERETQTIEYMAANDPERFRITRQTTFGRRHVSSCAANPTQLWIKCFLRQFFNSVAKIDYFTLRHGFISAHLSTNNSFNFQKYIQRSLEDDFKAVVGVSPIMWFIVVIFLLLDVHGWNFYLWVSFLPLIIVLIIGTKLEVIVARMAMQVTDQNTVIKGTPLVRPGNNFFWFKRPQLVLTLIHFTLFMNAFEFSFFIWVTWQFGIRSCYHENIEVIVVRVVLAVMVQVVCSYITLPLYALVTQMGSQYKSAILEEHTIHAIKQWHKGVKQKNMRLIRKGDDPITSSGQSEHNSSYLSTTNSPDVSSHSHHRAPSFTEISSDGGGDEITEDIYENRQRDHRYSPEEQMYQQGV